VSMIKIVKEKL